MKTSSEIKKEIYNKYRDLANRGDLPLSKFKDALDEAGNEFKENYVLKKVHEKQKVSYDKSKEELLRVKKELSLLKQSLKVLGVDIDRKLNE